MLKPYSVADVKFQLGKEIGGEGKNSTVHVAHDPQLDAELVIKKVAKNTLDADLFFTESACIYASTHSNVVPIHYACQDADFIYLAMPYYAKGSLKALMSQRYLSVGEIVVFATQFLGGLHNIHSKGLVHFDIKPDNILLSDRDEALVADFGLARARGLNGLAEQDRLYSKMVPPEYFTHEEYDHTYDIYQAGLTLFRMAVGDDAFYEQLEKYIDAGKLDRHRYKHAVINGQFPDTEPSVFPEHIPEALIRAIRNCLKPKEERYASCVALVNDLADIDGNVLLWRYERTTNGERWVKEADGILVTLERAADGASAATKGRVGEQARRITAYSGPSLNRQRTKKFLREY